MVSLMRCGLDDRNNFWFNPKWYRWIVATLVWCMMYDVSTWIVDFSLHQHWLLVWKWV